MILHRGYFFPKKVFFFSILLLVGILIDGGCKQNSGAFYSNAKPLIYLSNVPPDSLGGKIYLDSLSGPQLSLSWWANDPDGFVVGYRYRWTLNGFTNPNIYHPYTILLNILVDQKYALIAVTQNVALIPPVYHYFATLTNDQLDTVSLAHLRRGDSLLIAGVPVFASNSDSAIIPGTSIRDSNRTPVHINPTSGTFVFESVDSVNLHTFSIEAIDNVGALSVAPAKISFTTGKLQAPTAYITRSQDTSLILTHKSDAFKGIEFDFSASNPGGSLFYAYQWVVDRDQWPPDSIPWSAFDPTPHAFIAGENMPNQYASTHIMYVHVKNQFGVVSRDTQITFHTIYPSFAIPPYPKRILLVNNSLDSASQGPTYPSRQEVENYYIHMLNDLGDSCDVWEAGKDPPDGPGFPYLRDLQKYSLVIFVADRAENLTEILPAFGKSREAVLIQYCDVGGNLIMTGWSLRSTINVPLTSPPNDPFYQGIIHVGESSRFSIGIASTLLPIPGNSLIGAHGQLNYPDIVWDQSKLDTSWHGGLPGQWVTFPDGFGETIYRLEYDPNDQSFYTDQFGRHYYYPLYNDQPLAVRYLGGSPQGNPPGFFNCVFFSFPLYYVDSTIAEQVLKQALSDVNKKNP